MQPRSVAEQVEVAYGLRLVTLDEVAGGADAAATLWRGVTADGGAYAVKASRARLAAGLVVTARLAAAGVPGVPAPLTTVDGRLWTEAAGTQVAVVPWVAGRPAVGRLDAAGWRAFGTLLAGVHAVAVPAELREQLPVEDYRPVAAAAVRRFVDRFRTGPDGGDAIARELVEMWRRAEARISRLPAAAEVLGTRLRERPAPLVLCHGDAHAYNLLAGDGGELWLIDWDGAVLAPRERDLMFVVEGVLADDLVTPEQQAHFFAGYGGTVIDTTHLAYYRCTWALEDLAGFAAEIVDDPDRTDAQRDQALRYSRSVLTPSGIVSLAERALRDLP